MQDKKGMTLIELLVVVSIIIFLGTLIMVFLRTQIFKGNDARRKADTRRIGIAAEEYEKDHNCYPLPVLTVCKPGVGLAPYLDKVPCDPTSGASYYYEHEDSVCPRWFRVYAALENENDIDYVNGIGPAGDFSFVYSSANAPAMVAGDGESAEGVPSSSGFYGCIAGSCVPISWDTSRPGPECDPNYSNSSCYGYCSVPSYIPCESWN